MSPALIFTTNGEIMALKSKQSEINEDFEVTEEKQVELTFETETADLDAEVKEHEVYYTISGKEQDYNSQWTKYNIRDFDVGDELDGKPEVVIFENEDKTYNAARLRIINEDEVVDLYFNYPKKDYPIVKGLKNIRTSEKDKFDFYLNCYDVCFSVLRALDENNVKDSNGNTINKINAIDIETVLKIIDANDYVKVRIIEGSPYNDYLSWGILEME